MKKISLFMATLALVLGFTACSDDTEPVFQKPTEFVLNTPALADQYYELTPNGTMTFTCSQPNYGFTASTTYGIQIALSEGGETYDVAPLNPMSAQLRVNTSDIATGICVLKGIKNEDQWDGGPAAPLYVRATAQLGTHGDSFIASNWIQLKQVKGYFAVPVPGYIYLVGSPEGWSGPDEANAAHYADWRLFEKDDAIGSKVYWGVFDMPAEPVFRFYTKLSGWDGGDSWGYKVDDEATDFKFEDGNSLTLGVVNGMGSYRFEDFTGGQMTIVVDMSNADDAKVTFLKGNQM